MANLRNSDVGSLTIGGIRISKKFSALVLTMTVTWLAAKTGLSPVILEKFMGGVFDAGLAYLISQGLVDVVKSQAAGKVEVARQEAEIVVGDDAIEFDEAPRAVIFKPATEPSKCKLRP